MNHDVSNLS